MTDDKKFRGIIVPILTPLTPDEKVDKSSLRRLVNYLIDNGVHGIWASGTTGEFAHLPDSERIVSMEVVVDEVAGRVPVIGNISCGGTELSVNLGLAVQEIGLDGVALTPPYYYPNSQEELLDHYRYAQDRIGLPLWVYNIPVTVKTAVAPGTVAQLAGEGMVVGIKDSSGHGENLAQLNSLCRQGGIKLHNFIGSAFRVTTARGVGVDGAIPGIANLAPAIYSKAFEAGESGDADTIREHDEKVMACGKINSFARGGSPNRVTFAAMKAALKMMGVLEHDTMSRPFKPFSDEEKEGLPEFIESLGLGNGT
jgi:4-hydroxy-tetrahydrodipicolinate synthase